MNNWEWNPNLDSPSLTPNDPSLRKPFMEWRENLTGT